MGFKGIRLSVVIYWNEKKKLDSMVIGILKNLNKNVFLYKNYIVMCLLKYK